MPELLSELLAVPLPGEGGSVTVGGQELVMLGGLLRSRNLLSDSQKQTEEAFGFKWQKRDTFESDASLARMGEWLRQRYGDLTEAGWLAGLADRPIVLDAGCGAAMSGLELFGPVMNRIRYLGVDVSEAIDVARDRFNDRGMTGSFMQADIVNLPFPDRTFDVIFSEGVLHHTDSTEGAIKALAPKLKPHGRFLFYVYRKKGPIREFTDDYVRAKIQAMAPQDAWEAMIPLTKLGKILGDLNIEIDIPDDIGLLEIPAGRIDLQRLVYWHVFKAFHHPDLTLDEMNHINYDWYAPINCHRQSPEQVRAWCDEAGLDIERELVEEAGITVRAVRRASAGE